MRKYFGLEHVTTIGSGPAQRPLEQRCALANWRDAGPSRGDCRRASLKSELRRGGLSPPVVQDRAEITVAEDNTGKLARLARPSSRPSAYKGLLPLPDRAVASVAESERRVAVRGLDVP